MARVFREAGIPAIAVWADSLADERRGGLETSPRDSVNAVFSVDLFNEGIDLPAVDTAAPAASDGQPDAVPPAAWTWAASS